MGSQEHLGRERRKADNGPEFEAGENNDKLSWQSEESPWIQTPALPPTVWEPGAPRAPLPPPPKTLRAYQPHQGDAANSNGMMCVHGAGKETKRAR